LISRSMRNERIREAKTGGTPGKADVLGPAWWVV
jgi:hypothetical protein